MAKLPKSKAIERLQRALDAIPELKSNPRFASSVEFQKWHRDTEIAISNAFTNEPSHVEGFSSIRYRPSFYSLSGQTDYHGPYLRGLDSASAVLQSMIDEIEGYWPDDDMPISDDSDKKRIQVAFNEVFIVHGRDDGPKQAVARFLERLELSPIILHEQPNQGRDDYREIRGAFECWVRNCSAYSGRRWWPRRREQRPTRSRKAKRDSRARVLSGKTGEGANLCPARG